MVQKKILLDLKGTPNMNHNLWYPVTTRKHTFIAKKCVSRSNSTLLLWVKAAHVNFRQVTPSSLWEYHAITFGQKVFIIVKFEISLRIIERFNVVYSKVISIHCGIISSNLNSTSGYSQDLQLVTFHSWPLVPGHESQ